MSTHPGVSPLSFGAAWTDQDGCVQHCGAWPACKCPSCYYSVTLQLVQFYLVCQCGLPSTVPTD